MSPSHSVRIHNVDITWDVARGDLSFFGVDAVLFWTDPSMYRLLAPLVDEVGAELFRVLVAHSSSLGSDTDHEVMVTKLGTDFVSGFLAWGEAVATAGWGRFEVLRHEPTTATALVRVTNPWELQMQRGHPTPWGCPFLQGKIIGLFSIAFGRACWADETIVRDGEQSHVDLAIYPSERVLDRELARLRLGRSAERERELMQRIDAATAELRAKIAVIEEQRTLISALRCPILQVWSGVLAAVLVGELGKLAMAELTHALLERVQATHARDVILDCTGVPTLGGHELGALTRLVAALRLLGARTTLVGLSPALARGLAADGAGLPGARTLQSLADALQRVVGLRAG